MNKKFVYRIVGIYTHIVFILNLVLIYIIFSLCLKCLNLIITYGLVNIKVD